MISVTSGIHGATVHGFAANLHANPKIAGGPGGARLLVRGPCTPDDIGQGLTVCMCTKITGYTRRRCRE
jgi:hypothetical protein